jgi:hypothetical protein
MYLGERLMWFESLSRKQQTTRLFLIVFIGLSFHTFTQIQNDCKVSPLKVEVYLNIQFLPHRKHTPSP